MDGSGKITAFDKDHYDQLITYLKGVDDDVNSDPGALGSSSHLKLDDSVDTMLHPGSKSWGAAQRLTGQAKTFGGSVQSRYTSIENEVRTFGSSLKDAEDVFKDTQDLATYDASQFSQNYPDVGGSSGSGLTPPPGTGTGTGGGGGTS
ncbi:MAG TPA: hypothetical protein VGD53_03915 [Actinoallomurus sp.]|jgi:hypothetical protein